MHFKLGMVTDCHCMEDDDSNNMHSHALVTAAEPLPSLGQQKPSLFTPSERLAKTHVYHEILIPLCHHISSISAMASISSSKFASRPVCSCASCFAVTAVLADSFISSSASNASNSSSGG